MASLRPILALILILTLTFTSQGVVALSGEPNALLQESMAQQANENSSRVTLGRETKCKSAKRDISKKAGKKVKTTREKCQGKISGSQVPKIELNPLGCYGQSDNPHFSRSGAVQGRNEITAYARSVCPSSVPMITVEAWVQRHHVIFVSEGTHPRKTGYQTRQVQAVAVTRCDNDLYRTLGDHAVRINGKTYYAISTNDANVVCG